MVSDVVKYQQKHLLTSCISTALKFQLQKWKFYWRIGTILRQD